VYLGRKIPKHSFRTILLIHQVALTAISCFLYARTDTADRAGVGLRLGLLSLCALGEIRSFVKGTMDAFCKL